MRKPGERKLLDRARKFRPRSRSKLSFMPVFRSARNFLAQPFTHKRKFMISAKYSFAPDSGLNESLRVPRRLNSLALMKHFPFTRDRHLFQSVPLFGNRRRGRFPGRGTPVRFCLIPTRKNPDPQYPAFPHKTRSAPPPLCIFASPRPPVRSGFPHGLCIDVSPPTPSDLLPFGQKIFRKKVCGGLTGASPCHIFTISKAEMVPPDTSNGVQYESHFRSARVHHPCRTG